MPKMIEVAFEIGDTVYVIKDNKVHEMTVDYIYINKCGRNRYHASNNKTKFNFREAGIGRDVFDNYGDAIYALWKTVQEG